MKREEKADIRKVSLSRNNDTQGYIESCYAHTGTQHPLREQYGLKRFSLNMVSTVGNQGKVRFMR